MQKKKLTGYESVYTGYGSVSSGCEFVSGYGFVVWQVSYTEICQGNVVFYSFSRQETENKQFWWTKPGLAEIPVGDLFIFIACNQHIYHHHHHHHQSQVGYHLSWSTRIDILALPAIVQGGNSFSFARTKIKIAWQEDKICINLKLLNSHIYLIC